MLRLFPYFIALLAGCILPFAFAPTHLFAIAPLSLLVLLFLWDTAKNSKAAEYGFVYGLGAFGIGVSWIYISIHTYGNTNPILAGFITGIFVIILSLFPAITGYLLTRFFHKNTLSKWLIAFPSLWALSEWLRSWIFSGFPWLLLGQSQTNSPLHGYIPIIGIYGTSFIIALSAALVFILIKKRLYLSSILTLLLLWIGGWGLSTIQWTSLASSLPIKVSLVQGNIPQSLKWSPDQALQSLNNYKALTQQHWDSQIIVWPESAVTLLLSDAMNILTDFDKQADNKHVAVITGIPIPEGNDLDDDYYNGVIVLGDGEGHYLKRHLVPFGEYVPFENALRGVIGFFNLPMSNFIAGPMQQSLLETDGIKIAPFVCYEVAYSSLLRTNLPEANLLVTLSNDAWFDRSAALSQHRQIAQVAAQLTGRYMLVATNSGETAIIDPHGKLLAQAPIDETTVLSGSVYSMQGSTPWVKLGNTPFIILFGFLLAFAWWRNKK